MGLCRFSCNRQRRSLFLLCIFLLCAACFWVQAISFMAVLFSYPTVIDIQVETPEKFKPPSLTICNTSPFIRSRYCLKYKNQCIKRGVQTQACQKIPSSCSWNDSEIDDVVPIGPVRLYNFKTKEDILEISETKKEFIKFLSSIDHDITGPFIVTDSSNFLICFNRNSRSNNIMDPKYLFFLESGGITNLDQFYLHLSKKEYMSQKLEPSAVLYIHSPFVETEYSFPYVLLKRRKAYTIHISLEEDRLLPAPYQTDCQDYERDWIRNGRVGPRSKEMCETHCFSSYDMLCYGCFKSFKPQGIQGEMCNATSNCKVPLKEAFEFRDECFNQCKRSCVNPIYRYSVEEQIVDQLVGMAANDSTYVNLVVDTPEVKVTSHVPQYMSVDVLGYFGGFLGLWLGISVWGSIRAIFDAVSSFFSGRSTRRRHQQGGKDMSSKIMDFKEEEGEMRV